MHLSFIIALTPLSYQYISSYLWFNLLLISSRLTTTKVTKNLDFSDWNISTPFDKIFFSKTLIEIFLQFEWNIFMIKERDQARYNWMEARRRDFRVQDLQDFQVKLGLLFHKVYAYDDLFQKYWAITRTSLGFLNLHWTFTLPSTLWIANNKVIDKCICRL